MLTYDVTPNLLLCDRFRELLVDMLFQQNSLKYVPFLY